MNCYGSNSELDKHPKCKEECKTLLAMKDSAYAKLKLEYRMATKKLKDVEQENKALTAELRQTKRLACNLQCELQSLVEKCATDLASSYPYMGEPTNYISQSLQPRNNETMLAELLRVEKAICARYKAKADMVDGLERELAAFRAKSSTAKRHDLVFNLNVKGRRDYPIHLLTAAEIDEQGRNHSTLGSSSA